MIKAYCNKVQVYFLKRRARHYYVAYKRLCSNLDCGVSLTDEITGGKLTHYKSRFNSCMDALSMLDTSTPTDRL